MQRYFAVNEKLEISPEDKYHIIKVMRMKKGDSIHILWDKYIYLCNIIDISNKDVKYSAVDKFIDNRELDKNIILAFSLVSEAKIDYILQKGTELGISKFIPVSTQRSKIKIDKKETKKIERWNKITKEASEQSYRNIVPEVTGIKTINELSKVSSDLKILCSTKENKKNIKNVLQNSSKCDTIIIVVGPEGGITDFEEEFLNENGFISTSLGSTILRTETAPIFAISAIRYELMR